MASIDNLPLVLSGVSHRIGDLTLLDEVSLTINPGAPTAILGPNGAGKSTLLNIAMGLMRPTSGAVSWGGRSDPAPLRRAIVFQSPVMLRRSVRGNILFALEQAGVAPARAAGPRRPDRAGGSPGAAPVRRRTETRGAGARPGPGPRPFAARRTHSRS